MTKKRRAARRSGAVARVPAGRKRGAGDNARRPPPRRQQGRVPAGRRRGEDGKRQRVDLRDTEPTTAGGYGEAEAAAGIDAELPPLDTFPNHFQGYVIAIENPEYTSICPKTGLPDFGTVTIRYAPDAACLELKALKLYFLAYRNLGIFYENAVNRILRDVVAACAPHWAEVEGIFTPRGGLSATITARYDRES
jgi:7-cyano-7-deazaguanine reductase